MQRISSDMIFQRSVAAMLDQQDKVSNTQLHISTGKRILSPSDDPAASARIMDLNQTVETVQQHQSNADRAKARFRIGRGRP